MLSSVSTLLLCLVICRSVVYQNGIGVMNIQLAEDAVGAGARLREGHLEPGLERRSRSRGPELGRWSRSRGPREDRCSKEYEHEEEEGLRRT